MTDEAKAIAARLRQVSSVLFDDYGDGTHAVEDYALPGKAADLIETQAREIDHWGALVGDNARAACKVLDEKDAEIERLREALGWYEKQANDCRKITREGDDARYALDRDGGERARAALAGDSHDQ